MVQKGQFLARSTLIPVGREVMEGTAHRGKLRPPLLVLPPRPEEGGGMDHVIAAELVFGVNALGLLAFGLFWSPLMAWCQQAFA